MFELRYHPRTIKFIKKLPQKDQRRLLSKFEILRVDPFAQNLNVKKLTTTKNSYRLRVGNLRTVFEIDFESRLIYIHQIESRGSIVY